ncbi:hypothetical protein GH714_033087 [Hevea brasiliensis]|uniref:Aconitase/3-isopropylmalate dehydratase large subunit alpha/beta/alpha domain-containing protein n=1 Tax=Hevea brasiliensis TaxID=3981 RepID=A0A6A6KBV1_HEVBR|nr:hypothetical protein GH714_033087 [Hevea brasiliensis]
MAYYYPDSVVGTDSHTTMIDGLGVAGWGVGGIEVEAAMLGQPMSMVLPGVVGFKLSGKLRNGVTATDLVLTVTQMLRKHGVVGKFVEFYGDGMGELSLADRATIANMSPEYGATMGFFPVDHVTLQYLKLTGRSDETLAMIEAYLRANRMFVDYNEGFAVPKEAQDKVAKFSFHGKPAELKHRSVVIAAITSCTNTSNPTVMLAAVGCRNIWINWASNIVGYGCTTCIGNSGELDETVASAISENASAVLSGNRNFEGRVHALTRANYLASPPLVVAYALAGTVVQSNVLPDMFKATYEAITKGNPTWNRLTVPATTSYSWDPNSTYIHEPPYFKNMTLNLPGAHGVNDAYCLLNFGDSITTDHISPAGSIHKDSPAAKYLFERVVDRKDINLYGSRRGNNEVMARGTFANIRLVNKLLNGEVTKDSSYS